MEVLKVCKKNNSENGVERCITGLKELGKKMDGLRLWSLKRSRVNSALKSDGSEGGTMGRLLTRPGSGHRVWAL